MDTYLTGIDYILKQIRPVSQEIHVKNICKLEIRISYLVEGWLGLLENSNLKASAHSFKLPCIRN